VSEASDLTINKTQGEIYWVACGKCHGSTRHQVLLAVQHNRESCYPFEDLIREYQIIECQGCLLVSFRSSWWDLAEPSIDPETEECFYESHPQLYPPRLVNRKNSLTPSRGHCLPANVRRIYAETHQALCGDLPILAGIGIRALVEAVCKQKEAAGKDLERKIDNLVAKGILTLAGAEILHSTRLLGNRAAHEVEVVDAADLSAAMDVAENLLDSVYVLPKIAERLPKRTEKKVIAEGKAEANGTGVQASGDAPR
jgi:hypothetical protein